MILTLRIAKETGVLGSRDSGRRLPIWNGFDGISQIVEHQSGEREKCLQTYSSSQVRRGAAVSSDFDVGLAKESIASQGEELQEMHVQTHTDGKRALSQPKLSY